MKKNTWEELCRETFPWTSFGIGDILGILGIFQNKRYLLDKQIHLNISTKPSPKFCFCVGRFFQIYTQYCLWVAVRCLLCFSPSFMAIYSQTCQTYLSQNHPLRSRESSVGSDLTFPTRNNKFAPEKMGCLLHKGKDCLPFPSIVQGCAIAVVRNTSTQSASIFEPC